MGRGRLAAPARGADTLDELTHGGGAGAGGLSGLGGSAVFDGRGCTGRSLSINPHTLDRARGSGGLRALEGFAPFPGKLLAHARQAEELVAHMANGRLALIAARRLHAQLIRGEDAERGKRPQPALDPADAESTGHGLTERKAEELAHSAPMPEAALLHRRAAHESTAKIHAREERDDHAQEAVAAIGSERSPAIARPAVGVIERGHARREVIPNRAAAGFKLKAVAADRHREHARRRRAGGPPRPRMSVAVTERDRHSMSMSRVRSSASSAAGSARCGIVGSVTHSVDLTRGRHQPEVKLSRHCSTKPARSGAQISTSRYSTVISAATGSAICVWDISRGNPGSGRCRPRRSGQACAGGGPRGRYPGANRRRRRPRKRPGRSGACCFSQKRPDRNAISALQNRSITEPEMRPGRLGCTSLLSRRARGQPAPRWRWDSARPPSSSG